MRFVSSGQLVRALEQVSLELGVAREQLKHRILPIPKVGEHLFARQLVGGHIPELLPRLPQGRVGAQPQALRERFELGCHLKAFSNLAPTGVADDLHPHRWEGRGRSVNPSANEHATRSLANDKWIIWRSKRLSRSSESLDMNSFIGVWRKPIVASG